LISKREWLLNTEMRRKVFVLRRKKSEHSEGKMECERCQVCWCALFKLLIWLHSHVYFSFLFLLFVLYMLFYVWVIVMAQLFVLTFFEIKMKEVFFCRNFFKRIFLTTSIMRSANLAIYQLNPSSLNFFSFHFFNEFITSA
jgi:hypothetical protein